MGVYTFIMVDHTSSISPARLFKALCLDNHNCLPKVQPQVVKSMEFVEGDVTSVGCVKQVNFGEGVPFKYVKSKVEELDVEKCYVKYTYFEGDILRENVEYVVYEAKAEPSDAGSHCTLIGHFHTKGDAVLTEEDIKLAKQGMNKTYEVVEEYLLSNPQVYV